MLVVAALATSMIVPPLQATTLRKLSLEELVSYADEIVVGKCEKTETIWLEKRIFTVATVQVSQAAKGQAAAGRKLEVYILGGSVKEPIPVRMIVPGAETMAAGEEMLLFLEKFGDKKQFHRVVGMAQGKLPVVTDPKTNEKKVGFHLPVKGVKWVDKDGKPVEPGAQGAHEEPDEAGILDGILGRLHKMQKDHEAKAKGGGK